MEGVSPLFLWGDIMAATAVALVGSTISGTTGNAHCYYQSTYACGCTQFGCSTCYQDNYSSGTISGTIGTGSASVFINGVAAANDNSSTTHTVACSSPYYAVGNLGAANITTTSASVFVNGVAIALNGNGIVYSDGTATITNGSASVFAA